MPTEIKEYLNRLLQKNLLIKQGAIKLLNTPSISQSARLQAQNEFQDAQETILQIEKQLELVDRLQKMGKNIDAVSGFDSTKNSAASSPYKNRVTQINAPKNQNNHHSDNNTPSEQTQTKLDTLIESLKTVTLPRRQVETTNQICNILISSAPGELKYPSMPVLIPVIWPMLMSKNRSVNACGYKLLRYFMTTYDDVVIVFYLYHKYHHHDRYYYYPYNKYSEIYDSQHTIDAESDLLDFYNSSDPYKPEPHYEQYTVSSSEIRNSQVRLKDITSIKPVSSKLTLPQVADNTVKKWWPLIFHIVATLVEDKGDDVFECIKFMRRVVELKGIKFLDSLCLRVTVMLSESVTASVSLSLTNFQSLNANVLESIELAIDLVECLCEFTVADSKLAYETKVIKFLIQILIDPPFSLTNHQLTNIASASASSASKISSVVNLVNTAIKSISTLPMPIIVGLLKIPNTRKYLVDCGFIPLLLSALIDPPPSSISNTTISPNHNKMASSPKLQHLASILSIVLSTWSGLGLFLENDAKYLKALINGLYAEQVYVRTIVMSIIAGGLRIRKLSALTGNHESYELWNWEKVFIDVTDPLKNNMLNSSDSLSPELKTLTLTEIRNKLGGRCCPEYEDNIVNQFTAVFLQSCLKCGLIDVLKTLFNSFENDKRATRWIALLLSEILYLRSKIIPSQIHLNYTISFKLNRMIERESRKHAKLNQRIKDEINNNDNILIKKSEIAANSSELTIVSIFLKTTTISSLSPLINLPSSSAPLIDQVTLDTILHDLKKIPDDVDIKPLITQTHLPATKEYREWNWALISILVRGILWNDFKFEETLRSTKFFKRLLSFYKPQKAGFVQVLYRSTGSVPGFTDRRQAFDVEFFLNRDDKDRKLNKKQQEKLAETYVDVGIAMFQLLLSKPEGVEILKASGIIQTISASLLRISGIFINNNGISNGINQYGEKNGDNDTSHGFSLDHDNISIFGVGVGGTDISTREIGTATTDSSITGSSYTASNSGSNTINNGSSNDNIGNGDDEDTIMDNNDIQKMRREGLFGPTRLMSTLAWGYIRFIGVLSSHPVGIGILEEYGVIDGLFRLIQQHNNISNGEIDMVRFIIREIDFKISGQLRLLMEKVATIGSEEVRIELTERIIGELSCIGKIGINKDYTIERWCVGILVRQSYSFSKTVSELAIKGLLKYVKDEQSVEILLSFNPDLGDVVTVNQGKDNNSIMYGGVLLWKVLGFEKGVEYVNNRSSGLIEQIVEGWADSRREWVNKLEVLSYKKMRGILNENEEDRSMYDNFELFEQLVKTESGVQYIINSGIIQHFVRVILIYCKFLKMGIEKELYGLGERRWGNKSRNKDGDDGKKSNQNDRRKSFNLNGNNKPRGLIQSIGGIGNNITGRRRDISIDNGGNNNNNYYEDDDDDGDDYFLQSTGDYDHDYEKLHDKERGVNEKNEEIDPITGLEDLSSDSGNTGDNDDDKIEGEEDGVISNEKPKEGEEDISKWEDKWLNEENDAKGLIEETKCSIWALGYLGQTDVGIFAIESVLEGIIEEKKGGSRDSGEKEKRSRRGDEYYNYYDYYDDEDEEEEEDCEEMDKEMGRNESESESESESEGEGEGEGRDKDSNNKDNSYFKGGEGVGKSGRYEDNRDIIENLVEIYNGSVNWELRGGSITAIGRMGGCAMGGELLEEGGIECCGGVAVALPAGPAGPAAVGVGAGVGEADVAEVAERAEAGGQEKERGGFRELCGGVVRAAAVAAVSAVSAPGSGGGASADAVSESEVLELYAGLGVVAVHGGRGVGVVQRVLREWAQRQGPALVAVQAVQVVLGSVAEGLVVLKSGVLRFLVGELARLRS